MGRLAELGLGDPRDGVPGESGGGVLTTKYAKTANYYHTEPQRHGEGVRREELGQGRRAVRPYVGHSRRKRERQGGRSDGGHAGPLAELGLGDPREPCPPPRTTAQSPPSGAPIGEGPNSTGLPANRRRRAGARGYYQSPLTGLLRREAWGKDEG